jgi:Holliday junction DNA helicase RuvA
LIEKSPTEVTIECSGVGYLLNISLNTYSKIKDEENCKIFAHQIVREDAHILFGFATQSEKEIFLKLITVNGVGPNTARMILSSLTEDEVVHAILSNQIDLLQSVKGIGGKTAQRIIIDLKDKIGKTDKLPEIFGSLHNTKREEALSALVMLGFAKNVAEKALDKIVKEGKSDLTVEGWIKLALKML